MSGNGGGRTSTTETNSAITPDLIISPGEHAHSSEEKSSESRFFMLAVGLSILASIAYVALMIVIFFVGWALAMYVLAGLVMAMRLAVAVAKEVISYAGKPFSTVKNKTSKIVRNARVQARKRRLVAEKREQVRARLQPQAA